MISMISIIAFSSCGGGGSDGYAAENDGNDPTITDPIIEGEKRYIVNPIESADFYYFTSGKVLYACKDGHVKKINVTMTTQQDGKDDVTENLTPSDFYKLGDYLFITVKIDGIEKNYRQLYGEIYEGELMRRPDIVRREMNNGRFSIVNNTVENYNVSDIRNLTGKTGIYRTIMCEGYYLGKYESYYDYGLWFCTIDTIGNYRSALYYLAEIEIGSPLKVVDEPGEMWY
jgi:hypothetical protein